MLSDSCGPYDLLDDLDLRGSSAAHQAQVYSFTLAVCERVTNSLPDVALQGLSVSRAFHAGTADLNALVQARVACWNFLGSRSGDLRDPGVCRVRLTICTMFAEPDDPFTVLRTVLDFATRAGVNDSDLSALLAAHFQVLPRREQPA